MCQCPVLYVSRHLQCLSYTVTTGAYPIALTASNIALTSQVKANLTTNLGCSCFTSCFHHLIRVLGTPALSANQVATLWPHYVNTCQVSVSSTVQVVSTDRSAAPTVPTAAASPCPCISSSGRVNKRKLLLLKENFPQISSIHTHNKQDDTPCALLIPLVIHMCHCIEHQPTGLLPT